MGAAADHGEPLHVFMHEEQHTVSADASHGGESPNVWGAFASSHPSDDCFASMSDWPMTAPFLTKSSGP